MATGNPWILQKVGGEAALRILSRELLTNPRLQTISNKMIQSIRNNKEAAAISLAKQAKKVLEKEHPKKMRYTNGKLLRNSQIVKNS